jgi:hypothetical protein
MFITGFAALLRIPFDSGIELFAGAASRICRSARDDHQRGGRRGVRRPRFRRCQVPGLDLGSNARLAIRVGAAIASGAGVHRGAGRGARHGVCAVILATRYIGLFNPRQENVSFIVVRPALPRSR